MARGELPAIYGERAAAVVVFVSAEYAARDWTRLERRDALSRAVRERREYCRLDLMTHHWPGCCPMLNRLGEARAFENSGAVQSARRYLARIEFDSGAADCFHWPRPGLVALVASQSLPGRAGRVDAPREQRQKISCTAGTGGPDC